jgi:oligopeptide/dipeptide ABC transporter ATP-binding protein
LAEPVLDVRDLSVAVGGRPIVEGVSLARAAGEMLGLVGESGCGKSVTALAAMRLLAEPPMRATGSIRLRGRDLMALDERALRQVRGREMAMIFQEPMTSLNPVFTVGAQIAEVLRLHMGLGRQAAHARAADLLAQVGIPAPRAALDRYPHQMSGGQRQRVMIAMALACDPAVLVADEPTTALDVTVQARILDLIDDLRRQRGMAVLLITHDLGVVSQYCDRVAVMHGGRIVKEAAAALFAGPRHRYAEALLRTNPAANPPGAVLPAIPGAVPPPGQRPPGCAFHPRCGAVVARRRTEMPPLTGRPHTARCWNPAA